MTAPTRIDFLVPGFSKCGTTTLCHLLDQHPDVYIPRAKELWYFSSEHYDQRHEAFNRQFAAARPGQLKGEGSVSYSGTEFEDIAIERIYANNPDCRFIFIARHPLSRIESSYREMHHSGVQFGLNPPFEIGECLEVFPQMLSDSLYWQRISKYRSRFGDAAIAVVLLEELKADWFSCLEKCIRHLGLDPVRLPVSEPVAMNTGQEKRYDTRLLRVLRRTPIVGPALARVEPRTQIRWLPRLGLRRRFGQSAVDWDEQTLLQLQQTLYPDSTQFLEFYQRPPDVWPFQQAVVQ